MNNSLKKSAALLALVTLLAACGSSPRSNHYVLSARSGAPPAADSPSLGIGPIGIPEYLNRTAMVYNRQGNKLSVSSSERWAEPLQDGIKRVVSINLASLVGTQNIRFFPWNSRRAPDYGIKINLLALDANDREAQLVAEWLLYRPQGGDTVQRRIARLREPLPAGELAPAQIAPAYSELLYQLSEVIAAAVKEDMARALNKDNQGTRPS